MRLFNLGIPQVTDTDIAAERAANGARFLDLRVGPDWDQHINLETLDIGHAFRCVLAQLGDAGHLIMVGPWKGMARGFGSGLIRDLLATFGIRTPAMRRSYKLLTDAWIEIILQRRRARNERTSTVEVMVRPPQQSVEATRQTRVVGKV